MLIACWLMIGGGSYYWSTVPPITFSCLSKDMDCLLSILLRELTSICEAICGGCKTMAGWAILELLFLLVDAIAVCYYYY